LKKLRKIIFKQQTILQAQEVLKRTDKYKLHKVPPQINRETK